MTIFWANFVFNKEALHGFNVGFCAGLVLVLVRARSWNDRVRKGRRAPMCHEMSADYHPISHICCASNHGRPNTRRSSVRQKSWANEQRVVADADLAYAGMLQLRRCSCSMSSAAFSKRSSLESPARAPAAPRPCNCSHRERLSCAVRRP